MDVRSHRGRDTTPDRAKMCRLQQKVKPAKRVQVVYYLSRNGLLEHPHYLEITLLANEPLRLKGDLHKLTSFMFSLCSCLLINLTIGSTFKFNYTVIFVILNFYLMKLIRCVRSAHSAQRKWHALTIFMVL